MVLTSERRGRVAVLTLNRPDQLNAVGTRTLGLLAAALEAVHQDAQVRALVIAGAGRAFCAGADLAEIEKLPDASGFRGRGRAVTRPPRANSGDGWGTRVPSSAVRMRHSRLMSEAPGALITAGGRRSTHT
jgi:enoyl-CoA hydratase/carnithine racemase